MTSAKIALSAFLAGTINIKFKAAQKFAPPVETWNQMSLEAFTRPAPWNSQKETSSTLQTKITVLLKTPEFRPLYKILSSRQPVDFLAIIVLPRVWISDPNTRKRVLGCWFTALMNSARILSWIVALRSHNPFLLRKPRSQTRSLHLALEAYWHILRKKVREIYLDILEGQDQFSIAKL